MSITLIPLSVIRAGSSLISGSAINDKIAEYEKKFGDLKAAFHHGSALNTEITVLRIAEQVDHIGKLPKFHSIS
jgi:hypothetical protein